MVDKKLIGQDGKPVPKLGRYERRQEERRSGALKGKIKIANDFDKLPEDIAQAFGMEKPSVIEKKYTGWHPAG